MLKKSLIVLQVCGTLFISACSSNSESAEVKQKILNSCAIATDGVMAYSLDLIDDGVISERNLAKAEEKFDIAANQANSAAESSASKNNQEEFAAFAILLEGASSSMAALSRGQTLNMDYVKQQGGDLLSVCESYESDFGK